MQHLIVPLRLIVRVEEQVRMALDHARHESRSGKLDGAGAGRCDDVQANGGDAIVNDYHHPSLVRRRIDPVEHSGGAEEEGVGEYRRGGAEAEQQGGARAKVHKVHGPTPARARGAPVGGVQSGVRDAAGHGQCGTQKRVSRKGDLCVGANGGFDPLQTLADER